MLSNCGLVQVLRVEVYAQGTIRLAWIGEGRYLLSMPEDRHNHSLFDHIIESVLLSAPGTPAGPSARCVGQG